MAKRFVPDQRNIGGRKTIADEMVNHMTTLLNIKPTLHTRPAPKSRPKPRFRPSPPMSEVYETFRRSAHASKVGSGLDMSQPHTFNLSQKLSRSKARKRDNGMDEHWTNIRHMMRRIRAIGTTTERKKNPFDPYVNPSLFFRKSSDFQSWATDSRLNSLKSASLSRPSTGKSRPRTSAPSPAPRIDPGDPDPTLTLKKQLMEVIIAYRLYQDEDLEALFHRTREKNWFLGKEVDEAIDYIRQELES